MINKIVINIIKFYKRKISVFFEKNGVNCKFYPTCSEYSIQALEKYGFLKAILIIIKRILKCNPFSKGGFDPLK